MTFPARLSILGLMEVPGQIDHYSLDHLIATTTTACIYAAQTS